jgi:Flp pilus assembly protein TadB
MTTLLALLAGFGTGTGVLLLAYGILGVAHGNGTTNSTTLASPAVDRFSTRLIVSWSQQLRATPRLRRRSIISGGAAVSAGIVTGWPVAILFGVIAGWIGPTIVGSSRRRDAAVRHTEDLATWAEQLRDTIGSAAGLREALVVTADTSPPTLRPHVRTLANDLQHQPVADVLADFAHRMGDPVADQIVVSLTIAAERSGHNLVSVLGDVADAARADAEMRRRTETSRAQTYADARAVTLVILGVFSFLLVINRGYLDPYNTGTGQLVLAAVGAMWLAAVAGLSELASIRTPPRLLAQRQPAGSATETSKGAASGGTETHQPGHGTMP